MTNPHDEEEFKRLRADYRRIEPPPYLAARIKASVPPGGTVRRTVWPAVAVPAALVLMFLVFGPFSGQLVSPQLEAPPLPSLAAAGRALPAKPKTSVPSFASIKGLSTPPAPRRPKPTTPEQQSTHRDLFQHSKESTHAKA